MRLNGKWLNKTRYQLDKPTFVPVGSQTSGFPTLSINTITSSGLSPNVSISFNISNPSPIPDTFITVYAKKNAQPYAIEASLSGDSTVYNSAADKVGGPNMWSYYVTVSDGVTEGPPSNVLSIAI